MLWNSNLAFINYHDASSFVNLNYITVRLSRNCPSTIYYACSSSPFSHSSPFIDRFSSRKKFYPEDEASLAHAWYKFKNGNTWFGIL